MSFFQDNNEDLKTCNPYFLHFLYPVKDGHLDFSHLTEFKNLYITEIYMKKQYKS